MLLEIDSDGIKKLAAKEFVEFITNKEIPFENKVINLLKLDMDDVIHHLDKEDIEVLHEEIVKLHKCAARFFYKLENKAIQEFS